MLIDRTERERDYDSLGLEVPAKVSPLLLEENNYGSA